MSTQACKICEVEKPISDFTITLQNHNTKKLYYKKTCKICASKKSMVKYYSTRGDVGRRGRPSFSEKYPEKVPLIKEAFERGERKRSICALYDISYVTLNKLLNPIST